MPTRSALSRLVDLHKALGHPLRLRLLAMLRHGPLCVCQMTSMVRRAASTVSEHLSELHRAGAIRERKEGRWVEYRLSDDPVTLAVLEAAWPELEGDPDVRADLLVLRELRQVPLDEICRADLDLTRVARPRLERAVERAQKIRESWS
jgi:DNA-binding transcriptional ArsR family regulator